MTPFRPEPHEPQIDPSTIQNPELRQLAFYLQFKKEQKDKAYLDNLREPMRRMEARKAEAERKRLEPFVRQRQELARKVFR